MFAAASVALRDVAVMSVAHAAHKPAAALRKVKLTYVGDCNNNV